MSSNGYGGRSPSSSNRGRSMSNNAGGYGGRQPSRSMSNGGYGHRPRRHGGADNAHYARPQSGYPSMAPGSYESPRTMPYGGQDDASFNRPGFGYPSMSPNNYGHHPMPHGRRNHRRHRGQSPSQRGHGKSGRSISSARGRSSSKGRSMSSQRGHGRRGAKNMSSSRGRPGRRGSRSSSRGRKNRRSRSSSRSSSSSSSGSSSSSSRSRSRSSRPKRCRRRRQRVANALCGCDEPASPSAASPAAVSPSSDDAYPMQPSGDVSGSCTTEGEMKCDGQGFATCANGMWSMQPCSTGTGCRPFNNSILCDTLENLTAEPCTQEGQNRCSATTNGYETCANGIWLKRPCNTNTTCHMAGATPQCV